MAREIIRKHYIIKGGVQGVGFRYSALYLAQDLDLTGWVENQWDGSVVLEAQGDAKSLDRLIRKLGERRFIHIDQITEATIPTVEERGFTIRY